MKNEMSRENRDSTYEITFNIPVILPAIESHSSLQLQKAKTRLAREMAKEQPHLLLSEAVHAPSACDVATKCRQTGRSGIPIRE
jgi:hypothetical protein